MLLYRESLVPNGGGGAVTTAAIYIFLLVYKFSYIGLTT